jgi:hypothetical protein
MCFKLVSKNNMGIVATLILVVLLSQSRFFNFLIDSALGRAILILFILVISCVNKILGVVSVLFIIIMFNQSGMGYIEGFTGTSVNPAVKQDNLNENLLKLNKLKSQNLNSKSDTTTTTSSAATTNLSNNTTTGREGFNTIDRESTILRGKRSNEVSVLNSARNQSEDVEPTEMSVFKNTYSSV